MKSASNFLCLTGAPDEAPFYQLNPGLPVLHGETGMFLFDGGEKGLSMTLPFITAVAVADWSEVAEFRQERDETQLRQHLRFRDGKGHATIVCDLDGSVLEVHLEHMCHQNLPSGEMVLSPCR